MPVLLSKTVKQQSALKLPLCLMKQLAQLCTLFKNTECDSTSSGVV